MQLDKAVVPGGAYRVGDRVVDANGRDLGPEGVKMLDKIDKEAVDKANEDAAAAKEAQAVAGLGGLGGVFASLAAAVNPQLREAMRNVPVTEPKAASQDEPVRIPGGVVAAEVTGAAGPTPVPPAIPVPVARVATESPADDLEDEEDVKARGDEHQEQEEARRQAVAEATGTAPTGPKRKTAAKKSANNAATT